MPWRQMLQISNRISLTTINFTNITWLSTTLILIGIRSTFKSNSIIAGSLCSFDFSSCNSSCTFMINTIQLRTNIIGYTNMIQLTITITLTYNVSDTSFDVFTNISDQLTSSVPDDSLH